MPKKPPMTVRVRNAAPFTQALYLEPEAAVVVEPGQEGDVPLPLLERIRQHRWELVPDEAPAEAPGEG